MGGSAIAEHTDPILVTGAAGFTGGALARRLLGQGHRVRVFVRDDPRAAKLEAEGFEVVRGDLLNAEDIDRAVAGSRLVYHIAALFRPNKDTDDMFRAVNRDAVRVLLDSARKHGVERFVHCSTCGVHGAPKNVPTDENEPFRPADIYQETKLEGELIAQEVMKTGQPVSIFRPGSIYGPGDDRFVKLLRPIRSGSFRMFGPGTARFHLTYIDDLVDGILLCGTHERALGEVFILAGPEYVSIWDLVRTVAEAMGVDPPKGSLPLAPLITAATICEFLCKPFGINPPLYRRRCHFFYHDRGWITQKARDMLGYEPRVYLLEGMTNVAQWYVDQGLLHPTDKIRPSPSNSGVQASEEAAKSAMSA
ncbi:MAG: NAD-dependent epimerase/dehydratase family protein [Planctomycetota bacterium]